MGLEEGGEVRPQGFGLIVADQVGDKVGQEPRAGLVFAQGRQSAGLVTGHQQAAGASAEVLEASPLPPGELLDAVDRDQISSVGACDRFPFVMIEAPLLAAQTQAEQPPALALEVCFELFESVVLPLPSGPTSEARRPNRSKRCKSWRQPSLSSR